MRYVAIDKTKPGMVLAENILDVYGHKLIGSDHVLTAGYIGKLKEFGFPGVYIADELSQDIMIETIISPQLRSEGIESIRRCDIDACQKVAKQMVAELMSRGTVSLDMMDLRSYDNYTHAHCVNVAAICGVIGMGYWFTEKEMENLVTAALIHDLGKMFISQDVLNKPGRLSGEEYQLMKSHVQLSYDLIRERWDISAVVKAAVLQHHENEDGSGYPRGIDGTAQSLIAKIIHVVDVYDALVSKRPYKTSYSPYEASEYLMGGCGILFDREVVQMLLKYVPLYPKGTEVELSDGRKGIICENAGIHNLRPIIRLMEGDTLDLCEKRNLNLTIITPDSADASVQVEEEQGRREMLHEAGKQRIVVVDDMKTNLQAIREILEEAYALTLLKSGIQALSYLDKNIAPDLILLDIDMPEMDGIETARRIRSLPEPVCEVPILFVTALCDQKTVLLCKELHAAGYIVRPYNQVYMKAEIKRILGGGEEEIA